MPVKLIVALVLFVNAGGPLAIWVSGSVVSGAATMVKV
jgi:hypothetical protein